MLECVCLCLEEWLNTGVCVCANQLYVCVCFLPFKAEYSFCACVCVSVLELFVSAGG